MAKKRSGASSSATPATVALTKLGIRFEVRAYVHDSGVTDFGREAAEALGLPEERVFKTLLADADGRLVVGIVPVSGLLDLKALAVAVGARKAAMAEPAVAERKTGYVVGGISPLGQRTRLPTVLDESALGFDTLLVSGGRRGLDIELSSRDLILATDAVTAPIARAR
jgi:Cys-tRNA(Pro)/Cys-tRNA(Cys) deacylase